MTQVYRLCGSAYRAFPQENSLHTQLYIHVSSPSTTNNEGGGWVATGPIGWQSGVAFSGLFESDNSTKHPVNRALVAGDSLWYLTGDRLHSVDYTTSDDIPVDGFVGNSWITRYTFSNVEAGRTGRNTGIYYCVLPSGNTKQRYIIGVYNAAGVSANTWRGWRYNIDTNIAEHTQADLSFTSSASQGAVRAEIFHNNLLYFIGATDGGIGIFSPEAMSLDRITWTTSDIWGPHSFCPYKGKLYCANRGENGGGGGSGLYIWHITKPNPVLAINLSTNGYGASPSASEPFEGQNILFTDRDNLFLGSTIELAGSTAFRFIRMSSPTGALNFDGSHINLFSINNTVRGNVFVEQNTYSDLVGNGTNNGQLITLMLDQAGTTGTLRQQWAWQGPTNAAIIEENTQGQILHTLRETARSDSKNGAGERIWGPLYGGPRIEIINYSPQSGNLRVNYTIYNNVNDFPAGTPCAIQLKYDENGHLPYKRGVLLNPSTGMLKENNTVLVVNSASGASESFDWNFRNNGISNLGGPIMLNLFISTTGVA